MPDLTERTAPPELVETLEASVRDIATGAVSDASNVQADVRRMLEDHVRSHPPAGRPSGSVKRARTA